MFVRGYVPVPSFFLECYAQLEPPMNSGEVLLVLHLMAFKWGWEAPFPACKTIAKRMGISVKMVRNHAKNLEIKGYLHRPEIPGRTNRFDLSPLFEILASRAPREKQQSSQS